MKKIKFSVGVLAFMGLAVLNFTQSESSFLSKAIASSSNSNSSSGLWSSFVSFWDSKIWNCNEDTCSVTLDLGVISFTYDGKYEKCLAGNKEAHCTACKSCDAINPF